MKKIILKLVKGALYLALVGIMMLGCKKDDEAPIYKVTFNVSPTDASVTLDGETKTATNGVVTFEKPNGNYAYSVSKEGYVEQTDEITVSSSDVLKEITLESITYELTFNISPTDASVTLNGDTKTATNGVVTFEKPKGSYAYSVSKEGYVEQTDSVTVSDDDITVENITLELAYEITFNVFTDDASVTLDGDTKTATNGVVTFEKPKGSYAYSVSKEGYVEQTDSVTVSDDDITVENITLELAYEITFNVFPADASVTLDGETKTAINGVVTFEKSDGNYSYSVSRFTYEDETDDIAIAVSSSNISKNIKLTIATALVEGGTFKMGSDDGYVDERPVHDVTLSSFSISKYEITNAQYCSFLNDYLSTTGNKLNNSWFSNIHTSISPLSDGIYVPDSGKEDYPVAFVTWYGASAFCKWAGGRLPTEAEWEFAARGGNSSSGYIYSGSNDVGSVAWNSDNSGGTSHPVGEKAPNELGIYDMSGNVWELCSDWYTIDYYSNSPSTDPTGPTNVTPGIHDHVVMRGIGYFLGVGRVATRAGARKLDFDGYIGFRLVL